MSRWFSRLYRIVGHRDCFIGRPIFSEHYHDANDPQQCTERAGGVVDNLVRMQSGVGGQREEIDADGDERDEEKQQVIERFYFGVEGGNCIGLRFETAIFIQSQKTTAQFCLA